MSPTWLRERVRHYARFVGLGYIPRVVFSQRDWRRQVPRREWNETHGNVIGAAHGGVVYINREGACCRRSSDDLCAHEVVHLRWPGLRHGQKFDRYVSELRVGRMP